MTPTATAQPIILPGLPSELVQRTAESEIRPVDASTRAKARRSYASLELNRAAQEEQAPPQNFERRRANLVRFEPARPQPGGFLAQSLGQSRDDAADSAFHLLPDAAARGTEAYRRAGAEPVLYSDEPSFYRILA